MTTNKLCALFLILGLAFQTAAGQVASPEVRSGELSPELKQNALALLSEVAREISQYNVPENRVRTGTMIADLMWEHDERTARATYEKAFGELQTMFANMREPEEGMSTTERNEYFSRRDTLAELRYQYVVTLARHDTQAASTALDALKTKLLPDYDPLQPAKLELQLASIMAARDPDKAYALARSQLAAEGIAYEFITTLKDLHAKDPRLAATLGGDVLAKIRGAKIRVPSAAGNSARPAPSPAPGAQAEIDLWQVGAFINAASEIKRRADRDKEKKTPPLFSDAEMRELVELAGRAYLAEPNPSAPSIGPLMPEILQHAPALAPRIRVKVGPKAARDLDTITESASYLNVALKEKTIEQLAKDASRAAPSMRNQRYADIIQKTLEQNEPEKAQALAAKITDREGYAFLFERIRIALPIAKAKRGDAAEVRKMLATLKTDQERIGTLIELASSLAAKGEAEKAKKLLDEALALVMQHPINYTGVEAASRISAVYAGVEPESAFIIAETGIEQMNKHIRAAILLDEFYDYGTTVSGELLFESANRVALRHVPNSMTLLKHLARADFKRTVKLADRFERSDIRLLLRLRIAQAVLDSTANEKEKQMAEKAECEDEMH